MLVLALWEGTCRRTPTQLSAVAVFVNVRALKHVCVCVCVCVCMCVCVCVCARAALLVFCLGSRQPSICHEKPQPHFQLCAQREHEGVGARGRWCDRRVSTGQQLVAGAKALAMWCCGHGKGEGVSWTLQAHGALKLRHQRQKLQQVLAFCRASALRGSQ